MRVGTEERLRVSMLHTAAIAAFAVVLWLLEALSPPETGFEFRRLLAPVLAVAFASSGISLLFWAQGKDGLRQTLRLPQQFRPRVGLWMRIAVRLLRAVGWLAVLVSAGLSIAGTQPDPETYYNLIGGLTGIFVFAVLIRALSLRFPVASQVFRVPWVRLIAFVIVYIFLHGDWLTEHGFPNSELRIALWSALAASYVGGALSRVGKITAESGVRRRWVPPPVVLAGGAALLAGTSAALIVWGMLGSLPNVSALLLNRWPHLLVGYATQAHFGEFYETRHLAAVFVAGTYFVMKLPKGGDVSGRVNYFPLAKAVGYSAVGTVVWAAGAGMAELGQGFPLVGAATACGAFGAGLYHMSRYYTESPVWLVSSGARLLAKSVYRTAFLGAFLALYGLLIRPLVYDVLLFAPIYEWMAVVLFAAVAINRMRGHARRQVLPEGGPPAEWLQWSRHVQTVEERRDQRLEGLVELQDRFVETGRWSHLWGYVLGLLLRNRTPLEAIPEVFKPMKSRPDSSTTWISLPGRRDRARQGRTEALTEMLRRMDAALAETPTPLPKIDEERLEEVAQPFVKDGSGAETLAVTLVAAYWQRGAPLELAVGLWFPLMTMSGETRRGPGFLLRRKEGVAEDLWERREKVLDAAMSHLFGEGTGRDLPVALLVEPASVYDRSRRYFASNIPRGDAIEILSQEGNWWVVRAGDDQHNSIIPAGVARRRILPGD